MAEGMFFSWEALAAHDQEVREQVAREIEARAFKEATPLRGNWREGMRYAARIARGDSRG